MSKFRKFLTAGLMVMVVVAMSGLVGINKVSAAAQAGDLIKMDGLSSVYYLGSDGKRYVFPNESVYFSWYADFSGVVTISATELQSYPLGSNVTIRPGTKLVKITTDPKVYAVTPGGVLHWVQSEADAIALWGAGWASHVVDVPDSFFTNYTIGTPLPTGTYPAGTLLKNAGEAAIYYWDGSEFRQFASEAAFAANRFSFSNVVTKTGMTFSPMGANITGHENQFNIYGTTAGIQPGQGTGLSVALNSMTPVAQSIPQQVSRVPFTKVNFTAANDGPVHLESVTVRRTGLTSGTENIRVWVEHNGKVVATKRNLNNDEAILTFSPALHLTAGQTVTLDILAEFVGGNVTGNMALGIAGAAHVVAGGAVISGSFPITGNLMNMVEYTVAEVDFVGANDPITVEVGDENVMLGEFDIDIDSDSNRDLVFQSITVRNSGLEELSKVLMNVRLENNGEIVSDHATFSGRYATFNLKNGGLTILRDDFSQSFQIVGDVIAKDVNDANSLDLAVQRSSDVSIYEKNTGFGVTYSSSTGDTPPTVWSISQVEIMAGKITVAKKATSPSADTLNKGARNVVVLLANIKADEAVKAEGLTINFGGSEENADSFENVKVYLNNLLLGTFNLDDDDVVGSTYLIDSYIDLKKGDNEVKVTVDVKNDATSGHSFNAILDSDTIKFLDFPEYVLSGIRVDAGEITGLATGSIFEVEGADLTFVRTDGYSNTRTTVQGVTDYSLGKFTVKALNDVVKINSIALATTTNHTIANNHVTGLKLFIDGVQIGSTVNLSSSGTANFSSLNYDLAKDAVKVIELKGNISSIAAADAPVVLELSASITARDGQNKLLDPMPTSVSTAQLNVVENGSLVVEALTEPADMYLASKASVEQVVGRFEFTATNDSANITEIVLENMHDNEGGYIDPRINSLKLYDGSTLVAQSFMIEDVAEFKNLANKFVVPTGSSNSKVLTVHAVLNNIEDSDATASGLGLQLEVTGIKFRTSSGQTITSPDEDIDLNSAVASIFTIVKSVPTVARQAISSYAFGGTNTLKQVGRFTVTADANGRINIPVVILDLSGVDISEVSNAVLREGTTVVAENDIVALGAEGVSFSPSNLFVSAGQTKTFDVLLSFNASTTDAALSVSLSGVNFEWNDNVGSNNTGENLVGLDLPISWDLSR